MSTIISRYILREMIPPFLVNLVLFSFIFLMANLLDITDLAVNHGVSLSSVLLLLICSIPSFLVFVFPMSIMMGALLAFLRLSHDNEVVALKAGGVSIYKLLPPVFVFCLIGFLATGFMSIYGAPWGRLSFKDLLLQTATSNIDIALKERTFNDTFQDVMLYVSEINARDKALTDIFIEDRQTRGIVSTIVAPKGKYQSDPKGGTCRLTLFNGIINNVDQKNKVVHSVSFDTYDFNLKLAQLLSARKRGRKSRKEMGLSELRQSLKEVSKETHKYYLISMEYHERFSIPFACFVLGLAAVPLGIQSKLAKRSVGMVLGLFLFLVYYILMSAGWACGESGTCPPIIGVWGPNLVIGAVGLYLLIRTAKERPLKVVSLLPKILTKSQKVFCERH